MKSAALLFLVTVSFAFADPAFRAPAVARSVGTSMLPLIKPGEMHAVVPAPFTPALLGKIVVWHSAAHEENVQHLVVKIGYAGNGKMFLITKGVNNELADSTHVTEAEFIGVTQL